MIKNVVLIGSGALATFYAAKWSSEYRICILGSWKESIHAIHENGIYVDDNFRVFPNCVSASLDWGKVKEPDLVVWLTKSYKNKETLNRYRDLDWSCPILILQNGLGQKQLFKSILKDQIVILKGVTTQGAKLKGPGEVKNTGDGDVFVEESKFLEGFPVQQVKDIDRKVFFKLSINAALNPTTAIYKVKNGEAIEGQAFEHLKRTVAECFPFFEKRNIFVSEKEYLKAVVQAAKNSAFNINSMLSDKLSGRNTEVNDILGVINKEVNSNFLSELVRKLS